MPDSSTETPPAGETDLVYEGGSKEETPDANDEGGGLIDIKALLRHLERFRWLLVKSLAAIFVGMILCLAVGQKVVDFLRRPLKPSPVIVGDKSSFWIQWTPRHVDRVPVTNTLGNRLTETTSPGSVLRLAPVTVDGRTMLGLRPLAAGPTEVPGIQRVQLNNYGPAGAFVVAFQIAFYGGLLLASPFLFVFLGQFIAPMLDNFPAVRQALGRWMTVASILFFGGVFFCYFLLLRVSLYGSVGFAEWMHFGSDEWSAENYISFVCKFMLAMGLGFELPVVLLLLVRVGILSAQKLVRFRIYWMVINMVASAFITPDGSPLTMFLMAAPLWLLYEISIFIARSWERSASAALRES